MTAPDTDKLARAAAFATGVALFAWFLFLIRGGLACWFDADDLMNCYYYWSRPWSALVKANLAFWSSYYRPGGGLFYRSIFALWGFHPLPFRIAVLALLAVNFALMAVAVWQLTGARWGTLVALMLLINPAFSSAYFDTGTIYDILAFMFFWAAFALYVRWRMAGRIPGWGGLALVLGLFVAALDAKEISVLFPAAIALYESVWHPPAEWKLRELWRWTTHEGRLVWIGGLFDAAYIAGKRYGPNSLWQEVAYHPHYSFNAYFESQSHYLRQLIYSPVTITPRQIGWVLVAIIAVAAISRRRALLWGAGFIVVGVLPLAFIPARGGFAYLVPSLGWAVYVAAFLDWLLETWVPWPSWLRSALQAALFALLVAKMAPWQRTWIEMHAHAAQDMQARYHRYIDQIHALIPAPRKGARILLLSDAEGRDDYDVYFVIRLFYGDPNLVVERMVVWKQHQVYVDPKSYDYLLDWVDNRFVLVGKAGSLPAT